MINKLVWPIIVLLVSFFVLMSANFLFLMLPIGDIPFLGPFLGLLSDILIKLLYITSDLHPGMFWLLLLVTISLVFFALKKDRVHRVLQQEIKGTPVGTDEFAKPERIATESSAREINAAGVEPASIKSVSDQNSSNQRKFFIFNPKFSFLIGATLTALGSFLSFVIVMRCFFSGCGGFFIAVFLFMGISVVGMGLILLSIFNFFRNMYKKNK